MISVAFNCVPNREQILGRLLSTVKAIKSEAKKRNLVGPQIRKLRNAKGWTQDVLAQRLQLAGWDVSRTSVAKLESRLRWVSDCELLFFAKVLSVDLRELFPKDVSLRRVGLQFRG